MSGCLDKSLKNRAGINAFSSTALPASNHLHILSWIWGFVNLVNLDRIHFQDCPVFHWANIKLQCSQHPCDLCWALSWYCMELPPYPSISLLSVNGQLWPCIWAHICEVGIVFSACASFYIYLYWILYAILLLTDLFFVQSLTSHSQHPQ